MPDSETVGFSQAAELARVARDTRVLMGSPMPPAAHAAAATAAGSFLATATPPLSATSAELQSLLFPTGAAATGLASMEEPAAELSAEAMNPKQLQLLTLGGLEVGSCKRPSRSTPCRPSSSDPPSRFLRTNRSIVGLPDDGGQESDKTGVANTLLPTLSAIHCSGPGVGHTLVLQPVGAGHAQTCGTAFAMCFHCLGRWG